MSYAVSILRRAQKELAQLPPGVYEQVRDAIRSARKMVVRSIPRNIT